MRRGGIGKDEAGWKWGEGAYLQLAADAHTFPSGIAGGADGPLLGGPCAVATGSDSQPEKPSCICRPDLVKSCLLKSRPAYTCLDSA